MTASKAQQKAVAKYMKINYDEFKLRFPKGSKKVIKSAADNTGETVNGYINKSVLQRLGLEEWDSVGSEPH